jgi:hypothetical protein
MPEKFTLVFDKVILEQLKKVGKNKEVRIKLSKMLDKIEDLGPRAGRLLDTRLHLYEIKSKKPPIRLYFKAGKREIYVFEYEMKTSSKKQDMTIEKLKKKLEP